MALLCVREPLKKLAGGRSQHQVAGDTIRDVIAGLEREHPALRGWILDEAGGIRRHINVYVNGERGTELTPVGGEDRIDVLPAISGGAA